MSVPAQVRRTDRLMSDDGVVEMLESLAVGRLATVGADGRPYVLPLLYVCIGDEIWVHNTNARGHLRSNVDYSSKVCFEVDEAGDVFPYGRFDCDTSIAYRSVVVFGEIRVVADRRQKTSFFDAFMKKYAGHVSGRPPGVYPRLDEVTVYAIHIERMTGKEVTLPALEGQWPAADHTKTPGFQS